MNKAILGIIAGLLMGAAGTWLVLQKHPGLAKPAEKPEEKKEESIVQHDTNGVTFLKLDHDAQEKAGLKTEALSAAPLPSEVKAWGRVLDPTPLVAQMAEAATARATLEASRKEHDRLKLLVAQENAPARVLEAAAAALEKDVIAFDAANQKIQLAWGKEIMGDAPAFARSLITRETALVRVDVSAGEALKTLPAGAQVALLGAEDQPVEAQVLGAAPAADPLTQGQGFLLLLKKNPPAPGTALTAWLKIPGDPKKGILAPRAALLRFAGGVFVYVQTDDEKFERREVTLLRPAADGWFISGAVAAKDKVVTTGTQQLLSAEFKPKVAD
ncbi:MAG: hypothetical protein EXS33_05850 [Pedosphaera sp.]|nr:hypothetical protein [Pedosphaera sp.]